jgi:hypothetical protein
MKMEKPTSDVERIAEVISKTEGCIGAPVSECDYCQRFRPDSCIAVARAVLLSLSREGGSDAGASPVAQGQAAEDCNCFSQINEHLKTYGGELLCNLLEPPRAIISTYREKAVRGKKMPIVFASFCPFCGGKYPKNPAEG